VLLALSLWIFAATSSRHDRGHRCHRADGHRRVVTWDDILSNNSAWNTLVGSPRCRAADGLARSASSVVRETIGGK